MVSVFLNQPPVLPTGGLSMLSAQVLRIQRAAKAWAQLLWFVQSSSNVEEWMICAFHFLILGRELPNRTNPARISKLTLSSRGPFEVQNRGDLISNRIQVAPLPY